MTAVINCRRGQNKALYQSAGAECQRLNIQLLTPCVNASTGAARPEGSHAIRLGLDAIQGLPEATSAAIVADREDGEPYADLTDFCRRAPRLPARQLEMLVKAGGLDQLAPREHCLQYVDEIAATIDQEVNSRASGQINLFDLGSTHSPDQPFLNPASGTEPPDNTAMARMETEALGIPISHRLSEFLTKAAGKDAIITAERLAQQPDGSHATVAGIAQQIQRRNTREGKPFLNVELQMAEGYAEVMVWAETLVATEELWTLHAPLVITGNLSHRDHGPSLAASQVRPLEDAQAYEPLPLNIHITETNDAEADRNLMRKAVMTTLRYRGEDPVHLNLHLRDGNVTRMLLATVTAAARNPDLLRELDELHVTATPAASAAA